ATTYRLQLSVQSRWKLSTKKVVFLTKLNFAAPMVSILGPTQIEKKRPERITLQAQGVPSSCANASYELGYRWVVVSGNLNLEDYPQIITTTAALVIPEFILAPLDGETFNVYNFSVECFVNTDEGDVPERTAYAMVTVKIQRSNVYVVYRTDSRKITRGDILVLDARQSQDPDYPTPDGQTFKGNFKWKCLNPERSASKGPKKGTACFGGVASGEIQDLTTCRQDIGSKISDGGVMFYAPLFDDLTYCEYARGVVMLQTANFSIGEYRFSVEATSYDGRVASADVFIETTQFRVPKILLEVVDRKGKYPTTVAIRIKGTEEGQKTTEPRTYAYSVLVYLMNPEYNPDLALERMNDPENPYTVDRYKYTDQTDRFDTKDTSKFETSPSTPNMVIKPNVLQPSTTYKLRLNIILEQVTGYADVTISTAGLPPRSGRLEVIPQIGTMNQFRSLSAPNWVADDIPLSYSFGYRSDLGTSTVKNPFSSDPVPVSSREQPNFVKGDPSPEANFSLWIYVDVSTPYGA
ncbi:unnamed protein product, partial [Polarella glacialis]